MLTKLKRNQQRQKRNRYRLRQASGDRLRLTVHKTGANIYAQVIDDNEHKTLCAYSSLDKEFKSKNKTGSSIAAAEAVGSQIGAQLKKLGHTKVVFDRGSYVYHGRVKALAESARNAGLEF